MKICRWLALLTCVLLATASAQTVNLRLLETTDIHAHIMDYDYYRDEPTNAFGLARTATLISEARAEAENTFLVDNGDLIQGNPMGTYKAKIDVLEKGEVHPVYQAMNLIGYDVGNLGNHEFNYGLEFLETTLAGADFPYVNANVYLDDGDDNPANDENYFTPYVILDQEVVDEAGNTHTLQIGVIGFVPPQIMTWDKGNLEGRVIAKDIVETAKKFVPQMIQQGADVIIAVPHSGFEAGERQGMDENAVYYLSQVDGIDAILFGHAHGIFPSESFAEEPNVNVEQGTINGVAAVMPGFWGDHLGVIDLTLEQTEEGWQVVDSHAEARPIVDPETGEALVEADPQVVAAVEEAHQGTLEYIRGEVAQTEVPITSYFAQVLDDPSVQLVNQAQSWYTKNAVQGTDYEGLPILSAAAPFKAGGRGGAAYYTDIPAGTLAVKNVADLYIYPNTLKVVKITSAELEEWLERSAGQFNQIDPNAQQPQALLNEAFRSYNYDVIDGVSYQIDVTEPSKYDADGKLINPDADRIKNLTYQGEAVKPEQVFLIATNNYRAFGGGSFPGLDGSNVIIDYLMSEKVVNPEADGNWTFAPLEGEVTVTFESSPAAQQHIPAGVPIEYQGPAEDGFATYVLTL